MRSCSALHSVLFTSCQLELLPVQLRLVLEHLISDERVQKDGNQLLFLKGNRRSQLQQCLGQSLSVLLQVFSFQLEVPSRVLKSDPSVQVQLLHLQLLHKGSQLSSILSHTCLSKTETIHDVGLIVLELHHRVLDLHQTISSVTHVLRHPRKTSLLWKKLPPLRLELARHCQSLGLDVVRDQFEDLFDILERQITDVDLVLQLGYFSLEVELFGRLSNLG